MAPLILKRATASRPSGQWRDDDYDVLENGVVVGRIFMVPVAPQDRPWMWASGHNGDIRRAAHGYEPTREATNHRSSAAQQRRGLSHPSPATGHRWPASYAPASHRPRSPEALQLPVGRTVTLAAPNLLGVMSLGVCALSNRTVGR
jgi:hypothetical protein